MAGGNGDADSTRGRRGGSTRDSTAQQMLQPIPVRNTCMMVLLGIMLLLTLTVATMCFYYGIDCLGKCPIQPLIPVYLICEGCARLIECVITVLSIFADKSDSIVTAAVILRIFNCLYSLSILIFGSVVVYGTYQRKDFHDIILVECTYTCFYAPFIILTINWVTVGIFILYFTCVLCVFFARGGAR